ncbi:MAG: threonine ammonia-lyase [Hyphomicrobium sp.]|jgi:threonine dehydratase|nr:threonine ammonia-lyase [Hyphomicrobium sp.]
MNVEIDHGAAAVTLQSVEAAARTLKGAIVETPFAHSRTLSALLGCEIWLKFENLQFTGAYKERGALNKLASLSDSERRAGVIAMSAGNHAQGVAYHASRLAIPATIVMPEGTPSVKVENTRALGARVILEGATLEDSARITRKMARDEGYTFIHPFDDPAVISGQGTVALEMLAQNAQLDDLVVPIGGGGLISGMGTVARALRPGIRVIGVEAGLYPSMYNLVKHASLPIGGDTLAEGIAVKEPGSLTRSIITRVADDIMLVSEAEIERSVALLIAIEKTVVEGAGAAGLAAVIADPHRFRDRRVGLVLCGGNIDARLLASVLTRELARDGRLARLSIDIPDRPGQLAKVAGVIGGAGANIVEVYHQRVFTDLPAKGTELNLVIETRDAGHLAATVTALEKSGYRVTVKRSAGEL